MDTVIAWAMISFSAAGLFAGAGALIALGLERWASAPKRYRLIMDAYAEGLKDGKAPKEDQADG